MKPGRPRRNKSSLTISRRKIQTGLKKRPWKRPRESLKKENRRGEQMEADALTEIRTKKKTTMMRTRMMMRKMKPISPKSSRPALKGRLPNSQNVLKNSWKEV